MKQPMNQGLYETTYEPGPMKQSMKLNYETTYEPGPMKQPMKQPMNQSL